MVYKPTRCNLVTVGSLYVVYSCSCNIHFRLSLSLSLTLSLSLFVVSRTHIQSSSAALQSPATPFLYNIKNMDLNKTLAQLCGISQSQERIIRNQAYMWPYCRKNKNHNILVTFRMGSTKIQDRAHYANQPITNEGPTTSTHPKCSIKLMKCSMFLSYNNSIYHIKSQILHKLHNHKTKLN